MANFRELGLNYLRFSQIAGRALRLAMKPESLAKYPGQGEASIKRYGVETIKKEAKAKQ